jgi:phospholipase C
VKGSKERGDAPRADVHRRSALKWGVGVAGLSVGCGSSGASPPSPGDVPDPTGGATPPASEPGPIDAGTAPSTGTPSADAAAPDAGPPAPQYTPAELLAGIETIVVVMMENRSFDHYFGRLPQDAKYPDAKRVDGLTGAEVNVGSDGISVAPFRLDEFTTEDPPHDWDACHLQWGEGKNDGFVAAHSGPHDRDVMGYYERADLPFMFWLADHFTVCDRWFASVMGPTWPNRYYLHACNSNGERANSPFKAGLLPTVWDRLKQKNLAAKNYTAGIVAWLQGAFPSKNFFGNPVRRIDEFFSDAKAGTLPPFAIIDPDFTANDDHPAHDVRKGQAFLASIYAAMAASPQWKKSLLVITYDEHGGFFDHVAPPAAQDDNAGFAQLGFRVPSIVIGPTVRRGQVVSTPFEHASVAATLRTRFGIASLSKRMDAATDLSSCIDPELVGKPQDPPPPPPPVVLEGVSAWLETEQEGSQPTLDDFVRRGVIRKEATDQRTRAGRLAAWLRHAQALGAVRVR